tara:strand:+ start:25 stop:774 length:750 start_codon:yes stop_codon:yes gene_type:complete
MKKLLLFDVHGTIIERTHIKAPLTYIIQRLKQHYDIGVVSCGKITQLLEELGHLRFNHYFSECGCVYHVVKTSSHDLKLSNKYSKNLRKHELYPKINVLVKHALHFLSQVDYVITGNFIDLRNGLICVSMIGTSATKEERDEFIELDAKYGYRKQLIELLTEKTVVSNVHDKIRICEGGKCSISIYPTEYDKSQVLDHLTDNYQEIHYFGDKYTETGNDYNIINDTRVIGHKVNNVSETINILSTMILI